MLPVDISCKEQYAGKTVIAVIAELLDHRVTEANRELSACNRNRETGVFLWH